MPLCQNDECVCVAQSSVNVQLHVVCVWSVCVPAFVHSPQVNTGEGGVTLVPFAGVRRAPEGEALHADLGNPISRLAVQRHVATIEAYIPHAACGEKNGKMEKKDIQLSHAATLTQH